MATYKQIFGKQVKFLSADPPAASGEGQVWYNSTSNTFKTSLNLGGVWSSGNALNTGRLALGGTGTQAAGFAISGILGHPTSSPPNMVTQSEDYDGTSWTVAPSVGAGRYTMGTAGTQTAALINKGYGPSAPALSSTETYDGSSWTAGTASNFYATNVGSGGTQTSAVIFAGSEAPGITDRTEEWDGSTWTNTGTLGTARYQMSGNNIGTQTAGLAAGGLSPAPPAATKTEHYDGSSWTAGGTIPGSGNGNAARFGLQTAAIMASGSYAPTTAAFSYDGTAWAVIGSIATGRGQSAGCGSTTAGVMFGGEISPQVGQILSEEYNDPTISIQTVTTS